MRIREEVAEGLGKQWITWGIRIYWKNRREEKKNIKDDFLKDIVGEERRRI